MTDLSRLSSSTRRRPENISEKNKKKIKLITNKFGYL